MKKIKTAYYYLFYLLYKRGQGSATIFPYDFIASLYVIILEILVISTRGLINRNVNKELNSVNSVGMYRALYISITKSILPHNDHNNR